ncbi:hypothetical protein [Nannocystis pusilla]|uniref:hypothetical protein n=1 Tax=Nannocystis pusilla TaxID=889268 RepID=UPI003B79AE4C
MCAALSQQAIELVLDLALDRAPEPRSTSGRSISTRTLVSSTLTVPDVPRAAPRGVSKFN